MICLLLAPLVTYIQSQVEAVAGTHPSDLAHGTVTIEGEASAEVGLDLTDLRASLHNGLKFVFLLIFD